MCVFAQKRSTIGKERKGLNEDTPFLSDSDTVLLQQTLIHYWKFEAEERAMLVVAVVLFIIGAIVAVANAYYMGKCFRVGQPSGYAHFHPCTFY